MTAVGIWFWEPMTPLDWVYMAALCVTGVLGHWFLIRAYDLAEASAVQPFAFLQLLWAAILGVAIFGEEIAPNVALGALVVVAASLFTLWRERVRSRG
jgi:drug/metabolite transporter (DMT)-like permease